jgi:16S rRNA (cytidine1402-2'-O)-methyltransferase
MSILYIVATPIGNLEDITLRAVRILGEVDLILCEDTRVSKNLLAHYNIKTPCKSFHQHSTQAKFDEIVRLFKAGKNIALITDAGTPGVSDPGGMLVEEMLKYPEVKIEAIPGPSAIATAISLAGQNMEKFTFLGFLPHKKGRQTLLKFIAGNEWPTIVYESVHRIEKLLKELNEYVPARQVIVYRELTKKFETVYRGTPNEVIASLKKPEIKGEFVVIIS